MNADRWIVLLIAAVLAWAPVPLAAGPAAGADEDATEPDPFEENPLDSLLDEMSQEDQDELFRQRVRQRLELELEQVEDEIEDDPLFLPEDVEAAKEVLADKTSTTRRGNIERISRAFAACDLEFGRPYELFREGLKLRDEGKEDDATKRFEQALQRIRKSLNVNEASYLSAAKHFLQARILASLGQGWDAVDAYRAVITRMPERFSFAAQSAVNGAAVFEDMGRFYYALEMYAFVKDNYELTLEPDESRRIHERMTELKERYDHPMEAVAKRMGAAQGGLSGGETGKPVQQPQEEAIAILTDLIKVLEESKKRDPNQKPKNNQQQQQQGQGQQGQQGRQGQQGQGQQQGGSQPQATNPAKASYLKPQGSGAIHERTDVREGLEESGAWSQLPPRKREQMKELLQQRMSDLHRDAIRDYRRARARVWRQQP